MREGGRMLAGSGQGTGQGLTAFLLALIKTPAERLHSADPGKLARKYGISPDHAAGYLRLHRGW